MTFFIKDKNLLEKIKIELVLDKKAKINKKRQTTNYRFPPKSCDDCHDVTQKSFRCNDFAIVTIGGNNYRINL